MNETQNVHPNTEGDYIPPTFNKGTVPQMNLENHELKDEETSREDVLDMMQKGNL